MFFCEINYYNIQVLTNENLRARLGSSKKLQKIVAERMLL